MKLTTFLTIYLVVLTAFPGCHPKDNATSSPDMDLDTTAEPAAATDTAVSQDTQSAIIVPDDALVIGEQEDYFQSAWNVRYDGSTRFDLNAVNAIAAFGTRDGHIHGEFTDEGDANFYLLFPGMKGNINWGQGKDRPIDVSQYSRAVYRLCTSSAGDNLKSHFYWFKQTTFDGAAGWSDRTALKNGCHVYAQDWRTYEDWTSAEEGHLYGIRFDFDGYQAGDSFDLDWFRLIPAPSGQETVSVEWSDVPQQNSALTLYIDTDDTGFDGDPVASWSPASSSGTYVWGATENQEGTLLVPSDFPSGLYHLYIEGNGGYRQYLDHAFAVNQLPMVTITNPSMTSGQDYSEQQGDLWDMSDDGNDVELRNVDTYSFTENVLTAQSTSNDTGLWFNTSNPIDTSYYRYFSIDIWSQYAFFNNPGLSGDVGGMMRVFWSSGTSTGVTEDIVIPVAEQWHTYTIDLSTCYLEGGGGGAWTPIDSNWGSQDWTGLRFDPNENTRDMPWQWKIRNPSLTGPAIADGTIDVTWTLQNDYQENTDLTLSYTRDKSLSEGNLVTQVTVAPGQGTFTWDTRSMAKGEYWLIICAQDPFQTRCVHSEAPLLVR